MSFWSGYLSLTFVCSLCTDLQAHVAALEHSLEEERERCRAERQRRKELHNTVMVRTDAQCHQIMGDTVGLNLIGSGFELRCRSLFCRRSWEETSGFTAGCDQFYTSTTSSPLLLDQGESTVQQQHETIDDNWNVHEPMLKIIGDFICQACIIRGSDLCN